MLKTLRKVFYFFDFRTKVQLMVLFFLMLLGSILEACGISLVVPFIKVVLDPSIIKTNHFLIEINSVVGAKNIKESLLWLSILVLLFYLLKNIFLALLNYLQARFVFSKRALLVKKLFFLYLHSPYSFHLVNNSADLDSNLRFEVFKVYTFVQNFLRACTEFCILIAIVVMLLSINFLVALSVIAALGFISGGFYKIFSNYNKKQGEIIQRYQKDIGRTISEGFGLIKEIKILGKENFFSNRLYDFLLESSKAHWKFTTLHYMPRLFLEVFGVMAIFIIMFVLQSQGKQIDDVIPTIGLFSVATIRLLPSLSTLVSNFQQLRFNSPAVNVIYEDIRQFHDANKVWLEEVSSPSPINLFFEDTIEVKNIHNFRYPNSSESVLKEGTTIRIKKGDAVAFAGASGAGKTTLVNIISGLFSPPGGEINVDGNNILNSLKEWQKKIGYVPQSIVLLDADIRSNVAFAVEGNEIRDSEVWKALRVAQLESFVRQMPNGIRTVIGENGVMLSGGQRQRLGIARALYHQPEILVLDEATSALDSETERYVSKSMSELTGDKTIIIIAHRLSTIKQCNCIYFMKDGSVVDSGTFEELISKNNDFRMMAQSSNILK